MERKKIKIYDYLNGEKPSHGQIVHLIGYLSNAVFYTDSRDGFYFVDGTGSKVPNPYKWFNLISENQV